MKDSFKSIRFAGTRPHRERPFDAEGAFRPVGQDGRLRQLAVRGAGARVLSQGLSLGLQIGATVVLARLLTPADFGVVAMVTTFSLLLASFGLNGFTEAIIQWEELDHFTASNLFWINLGAGLLLTAGFAAAGSLLARLYGNGHVTLITIALAPTIFLASVSYTHLALLARGMRFPAVSANEVFARGVYVVVAIALAFLGWGFWALVGGLLAQQVSTTLGAWWICAWRPSLPRRTASTGPMFHFAMIVFTRYGVRYGSRNLDKLLVGWRFNAAALGFYKKAFDLFALAASQSVAPIGDVALAALSRLTRDPAKFRRAVLSLLTLIAFVGMEVGGDLTLCGKDVVRLVLGPQWAEAGTIFTYFGPGVGLMLLHGVHGWIHLSLGTPGRWLRWTLLELGCTVLVLVLALRWGPEGIAAAWSVLFWALTLPALWYAGRPIQLRTESVLSAIWKFVAAFAVASAISIPIVREIPSFAGLEGVEAALARIVIISGLYTALYLAAVIALHRGCAPLYEFKKLITEMVRPKRSVSEQEVAVGARV